jgi:hypothetical protein
VKAELISDIIGRCHDCITKVEQLHSLKSVSDQLIDTTSMIINNLDES